jgi:hypothetical protein
VHNGTSAVVQDGGSVSRSISAELAVPLLQQ